MTRYDSDDEVEAGVFMFMLQQKKRKEPLTNLHLNILVKSKIR